MTGEIPRVQHIAQLGRWRDRRVIKTITGARQPGKSIPLQQYQAHLASSSGGSESTFGINFESLDQEAPAPLKN